MVIVGLVIVGFIAYAIVNRSDSRDIPSRSAPRLDKRGEYVLDAFDLVELQHQGKITYSEDRSSVTINVHNGTDSHLKRMTIEVHVWEGDDKTLYRQKYDLSSFSGIEPRSAGEFYATLGFGFKQGQKWNYTVLSVVGAPAKR